MSLPKFVLSPIPTAMAVDLERLCPTTDRYRIFAEQVYPLLAKARAVLEKEAYCSNNGRVAIEPVLLLGVSLLQYLDRVPDRQAVELMRYHWGWNLALHRHLQEPGFDRSVLSYFRERLTEHAQSGLIFEQILEGLVAAGLVNRRSRQRLDSTQMWGVLREMSWLDCVRESLRLALEELETQAPLARPAFWPELWQEYVESKPDYRAGSEVLARQLEAAGVEVARLLAWLESLPDPVPGQGPAVRLLRRVFAEHFEFRGEAEPTRHRQQLNPDRVYNPHEPEAHYAVKGRGKQKREHVGYKVQIAETVDPQALAAGEPTREFITGIVTQPAEQSDEAGAKAMAAQQASRGWEPPPVQYVDGAYISGKELAQAQAEGRQLIGPAQSPPPLGGGRFTVEAFQIRVEERRAVCPAGRANTQCSRVADKKRGRVEYRFEWTTHCAQCPLRAQCLEPDQSHRRLEVGEHHSLVQARRQEQKTESFQKEYQHRSGIEGTISELKRGHGLGQARYRGQAKVSLQNFFIGAACNVKRWTRRILWALEQGLPPARAGVPSG
jgi:transposase